MLYITHHKQYKRSTDLKAIVHGSCNSRLIPDSLIIRVSKVIHMHPIYSLLQERFVIMGFSTNSLLKCEPSNTELFSAITYSPMIHSCIQFTYHNLQCDLIFSECSSMKLMKLNSQQ